MIGETVCVKWYFPNDQLPTLSLYMAMIVILFTKVSSHT